MKPKAVLFDLDGTLLDTLGDIAAAADHGLSQVGLPTHDRAVYRRLVGHGIRRLFDQAVPEGTAPEVYQQALSAYLAYYPAHCTVHTACFPGVQEFLARLQSQGSPMAIISNKTETTANRVITHYFPDISWAFLWGNNGARPLKPALDAGTLACETLGLKPAEIAFVGDGDTDMAFASQMGFVAAGVTWGYRDREELLAAGADFLVDSFEALAQKLEL